MSKVKLTIYCRSKDRHITLPDCRDCPEDCVLKGIRLVDVKETKGKVCEAVNDDGGNPKGGEAR